MIRLIKSPGSFAHHNELKQRVGVSLKSLVSPVANGQARIWRIDDPKIPSIAASMYPFVKASSYSIVTSKAEGLSKECRPTNTDSKVI